MSVTEHDRRVLHQALVAVLGEREADILMEQLPPTGWGELARRADLDHLAVELRLELQTLEAKLSSAFHRDLVRQTWILTGTLLAGMGALGGLLR